MFSQCDQKFGSQRERNDLKYRECFLFFLIHRHMKECDNFRSFQGVLGLLEDSQKEMNRDEPRRVCYGAVLGMIK